MSYSADYSLDDMTCAFAVDDIACEYALDDMTCDFEVTNIVSYLLTEDSGIIYTEDGNPLEVE